MYDYYILKVMIMSPTLGYEGTLLVFSFVVVKFGSLE
jgi:hypothetical protein